jgi:hypothetical protein
MKTIREAIWEVEFSRVMRLAEDWDKYEVQGTIGDCELHEATMAYLNAKGSPVSDYEWVMRQFAFEAYRRLGKSRD